MAPDPFAPLLAVSSSMMEDLKFPFVSTTGQKLRHTRVLWDDLCGDLDLQSRVTDA
jgi:hypothetical protein